MIQFLHLCVFVSLTFAASIPVLIFNGAAVSVQLPAFATGRRSHVYHLKSHPRYILKISYKEEPIYDISQDTESTILKYLKELGTSILISPNSVAYIIKLKGGSTIRELYESDTFKDSIDLDPYKEAFATALAKLHANKIVHYDLSENNILFERVAGKIIAHIIDFGLSEIVTESNSSSAFIADEIEAEGVFMTIEEMLADGRKNFEE